MFVYAAPVYTKLRHFPNINLKRMKVKQPCGAYIWGVFTHDTGLTFMLVFVCRNSLLWSFRAMCWVRSCQGLIDIKHYVRLSL